MKIYLLESGDGTDGSPYSVEGVFATREIAEAERHRLREFGFIEYTVHEWQVETELPEPPLPEPPRSVVETEPRLISDSVMDAIYAQALRDTPAFARMRRTKKEES